MKKPANIHNLESLEREIYRLKLEAKGLEKKLDDNFDHLQHNYGQMFMNSFSHKNRNQENRSFFQSFIQNETVRDALNRLGNHIADKAASGIDELIDRIFHKKK